ncbi:MAG TPA: alkaline phosphatase family protein [Candidatus Binataceae bacterium]|nr:alkaline phosphatase family protein [Candidatus Binataceae bacterium]
MALFLMIVVAAMPAAAAPADHAAKTPIKHLIVVVGENRSFDHLFATYQPIAGQSVFNLIAQGIVNADGSPGPNFKKAEQWQAENKETYSIAPSKTSPFAVLPQPNSAGAPWQSLGAPDGRFPANLPNGPFQLSKYAPYQLSHTGDPVHRFFQMWQQFDQGKLDLFPWVGVTIGMGSAGRKLPAPFTDQSTYQGGVSMGFYNMSQGDAPVFKFIADNYALSDNYHQGVMGGTGADFIYLGTADIAYYNDGNGNPTTPPDYQIENPNPRSGTNNWYINDGNRGGSYVNCADDKQPGVSPILDYLKTINVASRCEPDHFYLVNNYGPAYNADASLVDVKQHPSTLPPQTMPNVGEALSKAGVSWKYYIGGHKNGEPETWCSICNPLQFSKGIMTTSLRDNIKDVSDFYADVAKEDLPAVSFVRPYEPYSGHPANSAASAYEDFVLSISNAVISRRKLFDDTAIAVTFDEGGGYYDSGYIQILDFFGDGTRTPLMIISPYVTAGHIDHTYYDHASILKFIEANWSVSPMSSRSRDNFPNPTASKENPYVPTNRPAIGDLTGMFDFTHRRKNPPLIIPGGI